MRRFVILGGVSILGALYGATSFIAGATDAPCAIALPVCARQPVQCFTTPCYPVKQTFANRCEMRQADAQYLYNGVCKEGESWEAHKDVVVQKIESRIALDPTRSRADYIKALQTLSYVKKSDEAKLLREVASTLADRGE